MSPDWADVIASGVVGMWSDQQLEDFYVPFEEEQRLEKLIAAALRRVRERALDEVLECVTRERNYREYRNDQDGSGVGACKKIAGYVQVLKRDARNALGEPGRTPTRNPGTPT